MALEMKILILPAAFSIGLSKVSNLSDILECNIERRGRNDLLFLVGVEIHCQLP